MRFSLGNRRGCLTVALIAMVTLAPPGLADDVAPLDDFETLTLKPFDVANVTIGDGTDWTNIIPGWTISFDATHEAIDAAAYNGWTAMDVDSWIAEQGVQAGRDRMKLGGDNNTALVADPDAWDDYPPGGKTSTGYSSYVSRSYDITGRDLASLALSFDWDFVTEDNQIAVVDVSFDGGTTWINLVTIASSGWATDATWGAFSVADQLVYATNPLAYTVEPTQRLFVSGTDFTPPGGATSMMVRFGCILSGNDWWFAVDNVQLEDNGGVIALDDFEGLALQPFPDGGVGAPPGDGSDWTELVTNWTIDNSGMLTESAEGAYQGWRCMDGRSWSNEQGGQQRSLLIDVQSGFPERNHVLVADPDAHDDYDTDVDDGLQEYNSYISRTYDVSGFNNGTISIEFDWETRIESTQRALAEVSFDGGNSWTTLLDVDSDDPDKLAALAPFLFLGTDHYASFQGPTKFQFGGLGAELPAINSNTMILRFGLIDAENNWWFAVDNIKVEAQKQDFVLGDANGDGVLTNADIGAFIQALTDPAGYAAAFPSVNPDVVLDFNLSGSFSNADIPGFNNVLIGN